MSHQNQVRVGGGLVVLRLLCRNTFTTFFAHIDNLCHFYWDITKAERTEQMIDALMNSAENTQQTLNKNN
jgi:hypothetical protein